MDNKRAEVRLPLAIIAICAVVAAKGVDFVKQALATSGPGEAPAGSVGQPGPLPRPAAADSAGLRLYARTAQAAPFLDGPLDSNTTGPAGEAVTDVLRVWPLAGAYWVRLAEIRSASGADIHSVLAAYQLSVLVAPFDGRMMLARQILGMQLWDALSPDEQKTVLTDLVSVWDVRSPEVTEGLRRAAASLSPAGRKLLRARLKARARLPDQQLADIGL